MRTRYKKYQDYGLSKKEVQETYAWLNSLQPDQKENVAAICEQLPQGISKYVFLALTEHKGYYKLYDHIVTKMDEYICGLNFGPWCFCLLYLLFKTNIPTNPK